MTQVDVATSIGISLISYIRYENGERLPRIDTAFSLSQIFGSSIEKLFSETYDLQYFKVYTQKDKK